MNVFSLVVEAPKALVGDVVKCLKAVMEQPWPQLGGYHIPIEVSAANPGDSWGETKPYKLEEV